MEISVDYIDEGSLAYSNWKAMLAGFPSHLGEEYPLYTDTLITGGVDCGFGPYKLINQVHGPDFPGLKPSIILRTEYHIPEIYEHKNEIKTDKSRYHGGLIPDEIASLISLCLGIRLKAGPTNRIFEKNKDVHGRPVALDIHKSPVLPDIYFERVLPHAVGIHSLDDIQLLMTIPSMSPEATIALVRGARLYQNAVWVAETDSQFAWLLLVSAVEIVANYWRSSKSSAVEMIKEFKPALVAILEKYGEQHVSDVAEEIAELSGSRRKFLDFLNAFLPQPPKIRPHISSQHEWERKVFRKSFDIIYRYRSNALHAGTPFPFPMCAPPHFFDNMWAEKPSGLAIKTRGAIWERKDMPMFLHIFEHIVRGALINWWQNLVVALDKPTLIDSTPSQNLSI